MSAKKKWDLSNAQVISDNAATPYEEPENIREANEEKETPVAQVNNNRVGRPKKNKNELKNNAIVINVSKHEKKLLNMAILNYCNEKMLGPISKTSVMRAMLMETAMKYVEKE
jgi:hypothetical protein